MITLCFHNGIDFRLKYLQFVRCIFKVVDQRDGAPPAPKARARGRLVDGVSLPVSDLNARTECLGARDSAPSALDEALKLIETTVTGAARHDGTRSNILVATYRRAEAR